MRRLYLQIYVTILAILVLFAALAGGIWRFGADQSRIEHALELANELATTGLPPAEAPIRRQQEALERVYAQTRLDMALFARDGAPLASVGRPFPRLRPEATPPGFIRGAGGPAWLMQLGDGRYLAARVPAGRARPGAWLLALLALVAVAVAIGAYPVARRLTRRLERLKSGVEQLGQGDLGARVSIEGKDEIAALAESFNRAAARIEELVRSHKLLLANCSHELRTPLARINVLTSLMDGSIDPKQRDYLKHDIAELDQLIEEILLASRLDAVKAPERLEDIDLLALAAEEAARHDTAVEGRPVFVRGDPTLLRRMVRNLIENARRYGAAKPIEVRVTSAQADRAMLEVRDHGPGIPSDEREKIFEPFYRLPGSAETGRGSGLGLALVRQIVRAHGGEATCQAADGGGSRFVVLLPIGKP